MFHIFSGDTYYPRGGALDAVSVRPTLREAQLEVENTPLRDRDWCHIARFDGTRLIVVAEWRKGETLIKQKPGYESLGESSVISDALANTLSWPENGEYYVAIYGVDVWLIDGVYELPLTGRE